MLLKSLYLYAKEMKMEFTSKWVYAEIPIKHRNDRFSKRMVIYIGTNVLYTNYNTVT